MRRSKFAWIAAAVAFAACSDDGPSGLGRKTLDFEIEAPQQIPTKSVVTVEARITDIDAARYPLIFVFEKANVGEPFVAVAQITLARSGQRIASAAIPVVMDPRIRVTVRESSESETTVSKTVFIDVLDFP